MFISIAITDNRLFTAIFKGIVELGTGLLSTNPHCSDIRQWGTFIANNINDILYFPLAFSRTILSLNISHSTNKQEDFKQYSIYNIKNNSFQINSSTYELGVYYFAVGL